MARARPKRAVPCKPWLERLVHGAAAVRTRGDAEAVHELRVAIARLRSFLTLGGYRVLDDDLRWLRREAAEARDLDVTLALEPPSAVAEVLHDETGPARQKLRAALEASRTAALLESLALLPPVSTDQATERIRRLARKLLRRGDEALAAHSGDVEALHALRRAARRLRFGLEWLGLRPLALIELQTALGEVGDRSIALRKLEQDARKLPRLHSYRMRLERELTRQGRKALRLWHKTRRQVQELAA